MDLLTLPLAIQKLSTLGDGWGQPPEKWVDYRSLGITPDDTPVLIEIVKLADKFWVEELQDDPRSWTPVHAWRALGQFGSGEALPLLIAMLHRIDDDENDLIQEEFGEVFALMGPAAVSDLTAYLNDPANPMWARLTAAEGLRLIGERFANARAESIAALVRALGPYAENDSTFNAYLIWYLALLKDGESAPLVEQAYQSGSVDESVLGDFEDYQVEVGIRSERVTPRARYRVSPVSFSDGEPIDAEERRLRMIEREGEKKAKKKRKEAKSKRKKNQKKK